MAIFLVGLCAVIVAATMPVATRSRGKADLLNKAVGLVQKELEAIRGVGYANLTPSQLLANGLIDSATPVATNTYAWTTSDTANRDNVSRILPTGTGQVKVEQVDIDLRRITVTVNWTDRGVARSFVLGTLVANL